MNDRKAPVPAPNKERKPDPPPDPPRRTRTTFVTGPCERRQVIYVGEPVEEVELHPSMGIHVCVMTGGETPVVIQKLYGPAVFADVRVTAVVGPEEGEWVVEQDVSDDARGLESHWLEVARFDCIHDDDKSEVPDG